MPEQPAHKLSTIGRCAHQQRVRGFIAADEQDHAIERIAVFYVKKRVLDAGTRHLPSAAKLKMPLKQILYIFRNRVRFGHRSKPGNHIPLTINEEFSEIPLDAFGPEHARRFFAQELE